MPECRAGIYTRITAEIVSAIENGAGEWRMPWHHDDGIRQHRATVLQEGREGANMSRSWEFIWAIPVLIPRLL